MQYGELGSGPAEEEQTAVAPSGKSFIKCQTLNGRSKEVEWEPGETTEVMARRVGLAMPELLAAGGVPTLVFEGRPLVAGEKLGDRLKPGGLLIAVPRKKPEPAPAAADGAGAQTAAPKKRASMAKKRPSRV